LASYLSTFKKIIESFIEQNKSNPLFRTKNLMPSSTKMREPMNTKAETIIIIMIIIVVRKLHLFSFE